MTSAKTPQIGAGSDKFILVGYFCFCAGLILGSSLVRKNEEKRRRESAEFRRDGKEVMEKFEQERKEAEAVFIDRIADAVIAKLPK